MVTPGTRGSQMFWLRMLGSSKGRVDAYTTWPRTPPVSPGSYGSLPQSIMLNSLTPPCQPSVTTEPGSIRPVEPPGPPPLGLVAKFTSVHSALAQYTAPGTRRLLGTEKLSFELRIPW